MSQQKHTPDAPGQNFPPPVAGGSGQARVQAVEGHHPGPRTYITVAAVLALITAVEVSIYYVQALRPVMAPLLLALSASKFTLVALFYMHLRFDSRLYTGLFALGLFVAASIMVAVLAMFAYHTMV